jgi:hypothetical protein
VERVTESGASESRQRVLVAEPAVEASETGARWLGVQYWRAVQSATRGAVRARWHEAGGSLTLVGGAPLLRFGPPELSVAGREVTCCYEIRGGLLAVQPGGRVTLAQRPAGDEHELVVSVEEYLPRLAARVGSPRWLGVLYAKAQSPLHVAVSRRYFTALAEGRNA